MSLTLNQLEAALDSRCLEVQGLNSRWYPTARLSVGNETRRAFGFPCKLGFKECFAIANSCLDGDIAADNSRLRVRGD